MNHASALLPFDMKRLALLAALLLVLRFLAIDLHHAVADHQVDEPCELCLVIERGGNAVAHAATPLVTQPDVIAGAFLASSPPVLAVALRPPPRGPPASLS
jgi:hypothetical protein